MKVTRITTASIVGLTSALTLMGLVVGFDYARVSPENPQSVMVWLLALMTGLFSALFVWSFSSSENIFHRVDPDHRAEVQCRECGGPLYEDWRLCPHCGARISDEQESESGSVGVR